LPLHRKETILLGKEEGKMKMKSLTALIATLGFILVFIIPSYGGAEKIEVKGTVAKISGQTVIVKDAKGKETIVKLVDVDGIKVGDKVEVKEGSFSTFDKATGKLIETRKVRSDRPI
jgi:hypothetical protein